MSLGLVDRIVLSLSIRLRNFRGKKFADRIEKITGNFHRSLNNSNFNMNTNGELRVLKILSDFRPACIFDVGANVGEWSKLISDMNNGSVIHAFEIVPATYKILSQNLNDLENVITNNFGLSDEEGTITINTGRESKMATAFKIDGMKTHDDHYKEKIICTVKKASDYIQANKIDAIDFVKIDVEGMDLKVIKGFENELHKVKAIQFEYGVFNIASHDLLADFYAYLSSEGFVIGKIFPRSVKFFEYNYEMENFHGSNFIAVRKDLKEVIAKLSAYSN